MTHRTESNTRSYPDQDNKFLDVLQDRIEFLQTEIKRLQRMKQLCVELLEGTKELADIG